MKVMILYTDRYGEAPIQKEVVEVAGTKLTKKICNLAYKASKWFSEDPINDEGNILEGKELESFIPDLESFNGECILSRDGTTAHYSGEESDYIFLVI
jgi:hypothetical protein